MPDPPPPSPPRPSRADGSDNTTDDDAAFTAALYSRIHGVAAATASPPSPTALSSRPSASNEGEGLEDSGPDAALHAAHRWSAARNEHDLLVPPATKPSVAPPAFVARVRERLQRELRGVLTEGHSGEVGEGTGEDAGAGHNGVHRPRVTASSAATPATAPAATTTFQGFLARLETDLASQYDRVLQDDFDALRPSTEGQCPPTTWSASLQADVPVHAASTFATRHGVTLDEACAMAQRLVDDVVAGYKAYFEAERDVLAVAERYDALQAWAHQSKALFAQADTVEGTVSAFDEMVAHYFQTGVDPSAPDARTTNGGVWANKMRAAKQAWLDVQAQRHVVDRLQAVVGHACTCKVCFGATVTTALVPCGHTLCKACAEQVGQCPFCNATFYTRQDLYFG
jgi:hypothetical protein